MGRETRYVGILGDLQRLSGALEVNKEELPQLELLRVKLGGILSQTLEITQQQAALRASKQEASKQVQRLLGEGQRLATVLRAAVKEHYGIREEKIAEFGLQPFRGRKAKPALEEPELPAPPPAGPEAPAQSER